MYAELTRKTCSRCKRLKLKEDFQKDKRGLNGLSSQCKECKKVSRSKRKKYDSEYWQKWSKEHREKLRLRDTEYNLKRKFNISLKDYDNLLQNQSGGCAICTASKSRSGKKLAVDHCHSTGKIRGLLCNECNTSLGLFKENLEILKKAINYLENSKK